MKTRLYFGWMSILTALLLLMAAASMPLAARKHREIQANRILTAALQLTDPALWTEARYTRHPSQADFFTPFQDFPGSLEHFPAGAIVVPPANHRLWSHSRNETERHGATRNALTGN